MEADVLLCRLEELGDFELSEPYRLPLDPEVESGLSVIRLVDKEIAILFFHDQLAKANICSIELKEETRQHWNQISPSLLSEPQSLHHCSYSFHTLDHFLKKLRIHF